MIQLINYSGNKRNIDKNMVVNSLSSPRSLDEFKINIVDLSHENIWKNSKDNYQTVNCIKDLILLGEMIKKRSNSDIVIILPQNVTMKYHRTYNNSTNAYSYNKNIKLKNMLSEIEELLYEFLNVSNYNISYENTITKIGNYDIEASYYFEVYEDIITKSYKSNKTTTVTVYKAIIVTALKLDTQEKIFNFLKHVGLINKSRVDPEWMLEIKFLDDDKQIELIDEDLNKIEELNVEIDLAKDKLQENRKYKSVLYENEDELVSVVFEMLESMLDYDLSSFIDEHNEDFLIELKDITFIGEIKGVTSNVRSEHISQLDVHYQSYLDKLQDLDINENVKPLLIINHQRKKNIINRKSIHDNQIELAKRNGSLIIATDTLLKLFEKYKLEKLSSLEIIDLFKNKEGLLILEEIL